MHTYDERLFLTVLAALPSVIIRAEMDEKPGELVDKAVELARETLAELGYRREHA